MTHHRSYREHFRAYDPFDAYDYGKYWPIHYESAEDSSFIAQEEFGYSLWAESNLLVEIFCEPERFEQQAVNGDAETIYIEEWHRIRFSEVLAQLNLPTLTSGKFDVQAALRSPPSIETDDKHTKAQLYAAMGLVLIDSAIEEYQALPSSDDVMERATTLALLTNRIGTYTALAISYLSMGWWRRFVGSDMAKSAVAHRKDQQLKPLWIEHCQRVIASEMAVQNLNDLLNVSGYNPALIQVDERTLKRWAREECGIQFKPGRPKK